MTIDKTAQLRALIKKARRFDILFALLGLMALSVAILTLAALFIDMAVTGIPRLTPEFFTNFPSRRPAEAGILSSWVGSVLVMTVTALCAVPMGIAGANEVIRVSIGRETTDADIDRFIAAWQQVAG